MVQFVEALSELSEAPIIILDAHLQIEATSVAPESVTINNTGLHYLMNEEINEQQIIVESLNQTYTKDDV